MKKIFFNTFPYWVLFTIIFVGCTESNVPFEGSDNYITSFSLTKDGITYDAQIDHESITVSVPKGISLDNASVKYTLSENASFNPNPTEITNWDEEQTFTVVSYNNSQRNYNYVINYVETSEKGTVILLTQEDVDKFALSNVQIIEGNLIIGSNETSSNIDTIKDLSALQNLRIITNNLTINNSFGGKTLEGLENVESIGSVLIRGLTTRKASNDSLDINLPNIKNMGEFYVNSNLLRTVSLPKLETAMVIHINSQSLVSLHVPKLVNTLSDITIESGTNFNNSNATTTNKTIKQLSFESLKSIGGSLTLQGLMTLQQVDIPNLENIDNNILFQLVKPLNNVDAPSLRRIGNTLNFKFVEELEGITFPKLVSTGSFIYEGSSATRKLSKLDLSNLEVINGDLKIDYTSLTELNLLNLRKTSNQLNVRFSELVTSINIPKLEECNNIYIYSLPLITSLDVSALDNLEKLEIISCYKLSQVKADNNIKNVTLNGGSALCDFTQFERLESIPGTLIVTNYSRNELFTFPGIKQIGRYEQSAGVSGASVIDFPDLETLDYFKINSATFLKALNAPKLKEVTDTWDTSFMQHINSGDIYIPNLKKIGTFKFYGGTYAGAASSMNLTNLDDFSSVTEISKVDIKWWGKMIDFTGLKNAISSIDKENWLVDGCAYNPTYEQMINREYIKP